MNQAIVLNGPGDETIAQRLCRLLGFFGLGARLQDAAGCRRQIVSAPEHAPNITLMGSAANVLRLLDDLGLAQDEGLWSQKLHSVFVWSDGPIEPAAALLKKIVEAGTAGIEHSMDTEFCVSRSLNEFCGAMAGVTCQDHSANDGVYILKTDSGENIITCADGPVFVKMQYGAVPIFFSTAPVIDIDSELQARDFDIRDHFLAATPAVMYIKWAFAETCFQPAENSACLMIDDPPLKPRYGYVDFQYLNDLMWRHHFTCSLAFIPWNWRRSDSRAVRLFKTNARRLSLSVHGCDHTRGEFGTQDGDHLRWKVLCASQRMKRHDFRTGLRHDPVMVFPQGIFSRMAMNALKGSEFIGVVNSEVISADPEPCPIKISDFWSIGLMNYDNFPIFTRRDPWQGLENFAFDLLLGKPCIAVVHHNDCHDDCRHVLEFIDGLNRLNTHLEWRDLGTVVRRSFRQRTLSPNIMEIEMFSKEALLENTDGETKTFCVHKRESSPEHVEEIRAGMKSVAWTNAPDSISFRTKLKPGQSQTVKIMFREDSANGFGGENSFAGAGAIYWLKTTIRRYLCEIRDNYLMGKTFSHSHV